MKSYCFYICVGLFCLFQTINSNLIYALEPPVSISTAEYNNLVSINPSSGVREILYKNITGYLGYLGSITTSEKYVYVTNICDVCNNAIYRLEKEGLNNSTELETFYAGNPTSITSGIDYLSGYIYYSVGNVIYRKPDRIEKDPQVFYSVPEGQNITDLYCDQELNVVLASLNVKPTGPVGNYTAYVLSLNPSDGSTKNRYQIPQSWGGNIQSYAGNNNEYHGNIIFNLVSFSSESISIVYPSNSNSQILTNRNSVTSAANYLCCYYANLNGEIYQYCSDTNEQTLLYTTTSIEIAPIHYDVYG
eukprot:TRINITY_DN3160_c0_g1_i1.p1 TRINITY_DN3160_c0_g1~~TRINITY_DN3160_c0_g1_i1.p1  ORF type:complete len:304 (-),score=66.02 TRINITY_DN3160_c0_g1_i1:63-974(-)